MKGKLLTAVFLLLFFLFSTAVHAQETESLDLRLSRDFGSSLGGRISGTFSYRVTAPDDVVRVEFYLDDQLIGEDGERPYRLQFQTGNYELGSHTLYAIGYTNDGISYPSNPINREFQSGQDSTRTALWIIIPILLISFGGRFLVSWIANRGQSPATQSYNGLLGGTICPNCGKPYAIHWWSPQALGTRFDRCPHCGEWRKVRRAQPDELAAALEKNNGEQSPPPPKDDDDLKRRLDDSRFDS